MDEHELPEGELVVGRNLNCQIRFNHASVSRRHLRLQISSAGVMVEDLGSSNGTFVNDQRITQPTQLRNGDSLTIGKRKVFVRILADDASVTEDTDTATMRAKPVEPPRFVNCEGCRDPMPIEAQRCPSCGRSRRPGLHSRTQLIQIVPKPEHGRRHTRFPTDLLVLYSSDLLSFEARARDLSVSGLFVATELLDVPGTPCKLTLLPDGYPAIELHGIVRRMEQEAEDDDSIGMGVEFVSLRHEDRLILANLLVRQQERRRLGT
jgi:pSer/pThr/pTyr-binding forkhead associated (FHA) protein